MNESALFPRLSEASEPPVPIPQGHVGPLSLPGTQREIWWTGRVAIGLRYERSKSHEPLSQSALWVQELLLGHKRPRSRQA